METTELEEGTNALASRCHEIKVTDDTYPHAVEFVLAIDKEIKIREDFLSKEKTDAHALWKSLCAKLNQLIDPLIDGRGIVKRKIENYLQEKELVRRAEQERINREEEARAEKERQRIEKRIETAERKGDERKIEELKEKLADVDTIPVIVPSSPKTVQTESGSVSSSTDIEVLLIDEKKMEFLREIVNGNAPISTIDFKLGQIKAFVKMNGHKTFPGLQIREVKKTSFRRNL